jgi:putative photosynthetic complex assembly protein
MATTSNRATFPRWFLFGSMALVMSSVSISAVTRFTGFGASRVEQTAIAQSIDIRFIDQADGTLKIVRARDNAELALLAADGSGFLRGVARSLFRQRLLAKIDRTDIFQVSRRVDGKHFIADPSLGSRMELDGFGPTNTLSVAAVLDAGLRLKLEIAHVGLVPVSQQIKVSGDKK